MSPAICSSHDFFYFYLYILVRYKYGYHQLCKIFICHLYFLLSLLLLLKCFPWLHIKTLIYDLLLHSCTLYTHTSFEWLNISEHKILVMRPYKLWIIWELIHFSLLKSEHLICLIWEELLEVWDQSFTLLFCNFLACSYLLIRYLICWLSLFHWLWI